MIFQGKYIICIKICIYNKVTEQVKYLSYYITYESDKNITEKVKNYNRAMGVINQVFKPSLVQIH
jgi:hypothetical protein